ncbi:hypothetical protein N2152v2_003309 [Parachlorella kessleri]
MHTASSATATFLEAKKQLWEVAYAADPPPIVKAGDLVLRQAACLVPDALLGSTELLRLVEVMVEVMRAAPGVGLAAPQIGVPLQVLVMEDREEYIARLSEEERVNMERAPFEVVALINPRLLPLGAEGARFFEGCLSVPGYQGRLYVDRMLTRSFCSRETLEPK